MTEQTPEPIYWPSKPEEGAAAPSASAPAAEPVAAPPAPVPAPAEPVVGAVAPAASAAPAAVVGPQTSSNGVVAFVLSIASWVVCPLVLAIVALVIASKADHEVRASNGALTGGGLITAAKIIAWVNIGVAAAGAVIFVLIALFGLFASSVG